MVSVERSAFPLPRLIAVFVFFFGCSSSSSQSPAGSAQDAGGDATQDSSQPVACPPALPSQWAPPAYKHASAPQPAACTSALIDDFYSSCLALNATAASCNVNWGNPDSAHQRCATCLQTQSNAATWGPLVLYPNKTVSLNFAGCIEIKDAQNVTCSVNVQAVDACVHAACDARCPIADDNQSFFNWQQCIGAARAGSCAALVAAAACRDAEADAAAADCVSGAEFAAAFPRIAAVFCSR